MAGKKNSTSITPDSRKTMRQRGRDKRVLILESIREKGLLSVGHDASNEETEKAVFGFMSEAAFNPTADTAAISTACLGHLMKKGWADLKPIDQMVTFEFDQTLPTSEQAKQILKAVSDGDLNPTVASQLITAMASVLKIEEVTELKDRIDRLEAEIGTE